ncbi:MAG TPA: hypothetical protein PLX35_10565 [Cyclobacteriaceae bacterium]|nr:hypothetical protein [Cyclobacteriaceae bacterium]
MTILCASLIIECTKQVDPLIVEMDVQLYVHDKSGNNLLDPAVPGTLNTQNIRIFYVQDGVRKEFFNPNLDAARNYLIRKNFGNDYLMTLYPYEGKTDNEETTTYIHWSDNSKEDTVKCLISKPGLSMIVTKVWLNGTLKYDRDLKQTVTFNNAIFARFIETY